MSILEKLSEKSLFCVKRHCSDVLDVQVIWVGNRPSSSSACRVRSTSLRSTFCMLRFACWDSTSIYVLRSSKFLQRYVFEVSSTFYVLRRVLAFYVCCSGVVVDVRLRWMPMVGWVGAWLVLWTLRSARCWQWKPPQRRGECWASALHYWVIMDDHGYTFFCKYVMLSYVMFFPHGMAFPCLRCGCVLQCIMITLVNIPASGLMIRIIMPWLHIPPPQWYLPSTSC